MIVSDQATIESVPDRCLLWFFKCQRYHDAPALTTKGKCRMLDSRAKDRVSKRVNSPNRERVLVYQPGLWYQEHGLQLILRKITSWKLVNFLNMKYRESPPYM